MRIMTRIKQSMGLVVAVLLALVAVVGPAVGGATAQEPVTVRVGATPVPHAEILQFIQDNLAEEAGIEIEIVEFTDYVQPNLALADGELDANYFQHVPYLEDFSAEHDLDLEPVVAVHIEPLGIYSSEVESLDEVEDGAVVAIPNDVTNAGRALKLLEANGLIVVDPEVGIAGTVDDVTENPKNLEFVELEAAQLPRSLEDTTLSVINGNYALEADLNPAEDALALEAGEGNPYANVLVVQAGRENDPGIQVLAELLNSPEVEQFIEETYQGAVLPAFGEPGAVASPVASPAA
jgi:D-methionine transport system substrate-binding protein